MPWTIPNLILHDKPLRLGNMPSHGLSHMFVVCGNPHCHHNAQIDASDFPDDVTFGDLHRGCFAPCAITAAPTSVRRGCMAERSYPFEDPITLPGRRELVTLRDAGAYIAALPKAKQQSAEWQSNRSADHGRQSSLHARIGMLLALNRKVAQGFDTSRNDTKWGKRKLKRDE